jgi:uncharacterized membrane protein (DUF4010 family)
VCGILWTYRSQQSTVEPIEIESKNPLELSAALLFALLFLAMLMISETVLSAMGSAGIYVLAVLTAFMDIDPFVLGLTQSSEVATPMQVAAVGVFIAASSNNLVKGIYSFVFSREKAGVESFLLLAALALLGLAPAVYFLVV